MGCDGCELWNPKRKSCYAGIITERYTKNGLLPNPGYPRNFATVTKFPGRMDEAARWRDLRGVERKDKPWIPKEMPRLVFISDMSDALSKAIDFEYLRDEIVLKVSVWPHIGMWLTKQPKRMAEFSTWLRLQGIQWPRNLWPGTSVTSQSTLWRIDELLNVGNPGTVRFISVEPMWERITFKFPEFDPERKPDEHRIHMAIFGGESGTDPTPFHLDNLKHGIAQCRTAGIKIFVKQLGADPRQDLSDVIPEACITDPEAEPSDIGAWEHHRHNAPLHLKDRKHGGDWSEWPKSIQIREFPVAA